MVTTFSMMAWAKLRSLGPWPTACLCKLSFIGAKLGSFPCSSAVAAGALQRWTGMVAAEPCGLQSLKYLPFGPLEEKFANRKLKLT